MKAGHMENVDHDWTANIVCQWNVKVKTNDMPKLLYEIGCLCFNMQWMDQAALGVPDQMLTTLVIWVLIKQLAVLVINFLC